MNKNFAEVEHRTITVTSGQPVYAGFWIRTGAFIIDSVIISIPVTILSIPFLGYALLRMAPYLEEYSYTQTVSMEMASAFFMFCSVIFFLQLLHLIIFWLYFACFESSRKQATWGKQLFGLRVTDTNGQRLSFARASGRSFAKIISYAILCVGFMMAGWTKQKRALHDFIAGTQVIKNR